MQGGGELRPHRLRHPPETRQWGARSQLIAAVFTKNIDRALRVAKAIDSGYVSINATSPTTAMDLPFGGYKMSGQGRQGWLQSLDNHLETKSVMIRVDDE